MCGIAGIVGPENSIALATAMSDQLLHRGPDSGKVWQSADGRLTFGHRRLAIIDLSPGGAQPRVLPAERAAITYNGEIYNYRALRAHLEDDGVTFESESDTEVLLHACMAWGVERGLQRTRGMFALALYDEHESCVWLARDRFGEKPLYWTTIDGSMYFASELKSLRAVPGFDATIDRDVAADYMRFGAISGPASIYRSTRQVPPGTALRFEISRDGSVRPPTTVVYFDAWAAARDAAASPFNGSFAEAVDATEEALTRSVALQMVSDVPLGAFLSGGIDSSTVVSLMQGSGHRAVKTFTIGFAEAHMSEADEARRVARHLGTDHTEITVAPEDALAVVPLLSRMYDEPFADSSQIPTHLVAQLARRSVTVALSGDAGDELFSGYNRYMLGGQLWSRASRVPAGVRSGVGSAIRAVPPKRIDQLGRVGQAIGIGRSMKGGFGDRAHKLAGLLGARTPDHLYQSMISHWTDDIVLGASGHTVLRDLPDAPTFTEQMMMSDTVGYLPNDILTKVDRAAMATSLETRVPLLDEDVYRLAWSLPLEYKVKPGTGKLVLREVLARHVPRDMFERPKMGFGVPLDSWLRGPLRDWADSLLSPSRLRAEGLLDERAVTTRWSEHLSGRRNWQYSLWTVLMFQGWLEEWSTISTSQRRVEVADSAAAG